ncbi:hypothetical protein OIPHN330_53210 (plasmid) [Citrobacter freundii]|uniref:hypothetical protein n=1 Tax=Enterobacter hormaechei TaxID=158836 RepID=UPI0013E2D957
MSLSDAIDRIPTQYNEVDIANIHWADCVIHTKKKLTLKDIHVCLIKREESVIGIVETLSYVRVVGWTNTDSNISFKKHLHHRGQLGGEQFADLLFKITAVNLFMPTSASCTPPFVKKCAWVISPTIIICG